MPEVVERVSATVLSEVGGQLGPGAGVPAVGVLTHIGREVRVETVGRVTVERGLDEVPDEQVIEDPLVDRCDE